MRPFLLIALSYMIGSVSPSILLGKLLKGIDIREHGSGNAGSTNASRILGKKIGITVMAVDLLKGLIAVRLAIYFGPGISPVSLAMLSILCGGAVISGHIWTLFHSFRGGKGVNTATGVLLGLMPLETIVAAAVFLSVFSLTGYISLGSIVSSISLPLILIIRGWLFQGGIPVELLIFSCLIPILIVFTHRSNIKRLIRGEENRSSFMRGPETKT